MIKQEFATTINNTGIVAQAQKAVVALNGFADTLKPFTVVYNEDVFRGDAVKIPVLSYGASSTGNDFLTDDSNTVNYVSVVASNVAKSQMNLPPQEYKRLSAVNDTLIAGMVKKNMKSVSDAVYGALINTSNFAATQKFVSASWSESAPTIAALRTAVGLAMASGKLDPTSLIVVMPVSTYQALLATLNVLPRDILASLGFDIVPVALATFVTTMITDKSAIGIGFASDLGVGTDEVQNFASDDGQSAYALHLMPYEQANSVILGTRIVYGFSVLNSTGAYYIKAA